MKLNFKFHSSAYQKGPYKRLNYWQKYLAVIANTQINKHMIHEMIGLELEVISISQQQGKLP